MSEDITIYDETRPKEGGSFKGGTTISTINGNFSMRRKRSDFLDEHINSNSDDLNYLLSSERKSALSYKLMKQAFGENSGDETDASYNSSCSETASYDSTSGSDIVYENSGLTENKQNLPTTKGQADATAGKDVFQSKALPTTAYTNVQPDGRQRPESMRHNMEPGKSILKDNSQSQGPSPPTVTISPDDLHFDCTDKDKETSDEYDDTAIIRAKRGRFHGDQTTSADSGLGSSPNSFTGSSTFTQGTSSPRSTSSRSSRENSFRRFSGTIKRKSVSQEVICIGSSDGDCKIERTDSQFSFYNCKVEIKNYHSFEDEEEEAMLSPGIRQTEYSFNKYGLKPTEIRNQNMPHLGKLYRVQNMRTGTDVRIVDKTNSFTPKCQTVHRTEHQPNDTRDPASPVNTDTSSESDSSASSDPIKFENPHQKRPSEKIKKFPQLTIHDTKIWQDIPSANNDYATLPGDYKGISDSSGSDINVDTSNTEEFFTEREDPYESLQPHQIDRKLNYDPQPPQDETEYASLQVANTFRKKGILSYWKRKLHRKKKHKVKKVDTGVKHNSSDDTSADQSRPESSERDSWINIPTSSNQEEHNYDGSSEGSQKLSEKNVGIHSHGGEGFVGPSRGIPVLRLQRRNVTRQHNITIRNGGGFVDNRTAYPRCRHKEPAMPDNMFHYRGYHHAEDTSRIDHRPWTEHHTTVHNRSWSDSFRYKQRSSGSTDDRHVTERRSYKSHPGLKNTLPRKTHSKVRRDGMLLISNKL